MKHNIIPVGALFPKTTSQLSSSIGLLFCTEDIDSGIAGTCFSDDKAGGDSARRLFFLFPGIFETEPHGKTRYFIPQLKILFLKNKKFDVFIVDRSMHTSVPYEGPGS